MRGGGGNSLNSKVSSLSAQKECILDLHEQKKKGFTLAETLITLTILGIVAALTVPNLVRRQVEASNRTKIKKAVGVYDSLMTKLTVQNNLKSNAAIQEWADDDCSNSSDLFKVVKFVSTDNKCQFKTADGVFWDITDIQKPIIALKEADLNDATAQSDTNRAFYLFAEYDGQGILRVTETTYDYTLTADKTKVNESVDRLIAFMKGETTTKQNEIESAANLNCENNDYVCKFKRGDSDISTCDSYIDSYGQGSFTNYCALNSNVLLYCTNENSGCESIYGGVIVDGVKIFYKDKDFVVESVNQQVSFDSNGQLASYVNKLYDSSENLVYDGTFKIDANGAVTDMMSGIKYDSTGNAMVECTMGCSFDASGNITSIEAGTIHYNNETVTCEGDCVYDSTTGRIKKNS